MPLLIALRWILEIYTQFIKATEKSQEFYESFFSKIQNSYSDFLNRISIFVAVIGLGIPAFSIYNNKSANNLKNQAREVLTKRFINNFYS